MGRYEVQWDEMGSSELRHKTEATKGNGEGKER